MTRVVILYNEPTLPASHPDADSEHEIVYTVNETDKVLTASGFEVERLGAHVDPGKIVQTNGQGTPLPPRTQGRSRDSGVQLRQCAWEISRVLRYWL